MLASAAFVSTVYAAEPLTDTDGDGLPDIWETNVFLTDPHNPNTDGDPYPDLEEIRNGFDPKSTGKLVEKDTDGDGLSDRLELLFGTNPTVPDTDGDTRLDGAEVYAGFSPTTTEPMVLQKSLRVQLDAQYLEQMVMGIPIKQHIVSSGLPRMPTPVGNFKILSKSPRAWSNAGKLWMPYWMHFSGRGHGLHELPEWPNGRKEGANHLGHPASHGCVRMGVGSAKEVYDWSPVGTPVIIVRKAPTVHY